MNGLDELAGEILEAAGLTEADVDNVPSFGTSTLKPPPVITTNTNINWPIVSAGENFFDKALANGSLEGSDILYVNGINIAGAAALSALDVWAKEEEVHDDIDTDDDGWEPNADAVEAEDKGADEIEIPAEDEELGACTTPGASGTELWVRNSPFAGDHVTVGSFETVMRCSTCIMAR
jgi:coatomer subunit alpha